MRAILRWTLVIAIASTAMIVGACEQLDPQFEVEAPVLPRSTLAPQPTTAPPALAVIDAAVGPPIAAPVAGAGVPCGIVDRLDAPLGPPDGQGYGARWIFGVQSRRYGGKFHAGEDWGARGGSSLGVPVHAIGHGSVVYAEPWGWGRDQGVVIVRHAFKDGSSVLSFYGHLDPSTVELRPGGCVVRGQVIALIGQPVTRPHLHFEIRDHLPNEPGPGYWPTDPTAAGWHAPSRFIWSQRVRETPGVRWAVPVTEPLQAAFGPTAANLIVGRPDNFHLVGLDATDGSMRWRLTLNRPVAQSAMDADGLTMYLSDRLGAVAAFDLSGESNLLDHHAHSPGQLWIRATDGANPPTLKWSRPATAAGGGGPMLAATPNGGLVAHLGDGLMGITAAGDVAWTLLDVPRPEGMAMSDRWLVLTMGDGAARSLASGDGHGANASEGTRKMRRRALPDGGPAAGTSLVELYTSGRPSIAADRVFVQRTDGVWTADLAAPSIARLHTLEPGLLDAGATLPLPDGGALIAHRGRTAPQLLRLDAQGELLWTRRTDHIDHLPPAMVLPDHAGQALPFLVTGASDVMLLDPATGDATRTFAGGVRDPADNRSPTVSSLLDGKLLLHLQIGQADGLLVVIDTVGDAPLEAVGQ